VAISDTAKTLSQHIEINLRSTSLRVTVRPISQEILIAGPAPAPVLMDSFPIQNGTGMVMLTG
jgi:hypothetical protein